MSKSDPNSAKICILLTATIDPKGVVFMKRSNPLVREKDHINALTKWMRLPFPVVFCENSGYELGKIRNIVEERAKNDIEILQFYGQDFPRELGKGYGELNTIKYAINHSQVIKKSDYVIKINGRYFIKNIEKIVNILSSSKDIYVMADLNKNLTWAESRVFAFEPSFILNYLSEFQDLLDDSKGLCFERALGRATLRAMADGQKWAPLPCNPSIIGYSGTSDTKDERSTLRLVIGGVIHSVKNYLNRR